MTSWFTADGCRLDDFRAIVEQKTELTDPAGYVAFHLPEFTEHFNANHVQLPLAKGDAAFFNPAVSTAPVRTGPRTYAG